MTSGLGLERPGLWAVRYPGVAAFVLLVVLAASLWSVPKLRFDEDINRVFLSQNQTSQDYRNFIDSTGGETADLALFVEKAVPFSATDFETMRSLAIELEFLDDAASIISPFSARFSEVDEQFAGQPVIPSDGSIEAITMRLDRFEDQNSVVGPLVSQSRDSALFIVSGRQGMQNDDIRALMNSLRDLSARILPADLEVTITGESAISLTIVDALIGDLLMLNALGVTLVLLLAIAVFRSVVVAVLAVVPAISSVTVTLGLFVLLDYPVTVISNVLPILILVFGIADSMHLLMDLRDRGGTTEPTERLSATIRDVGPACALSAITTSIGFLAISISDNDQLFEFAVAGGLSVLAAFFVTITAFALLGRFAIRKFPPRHRASERTILAVIADVSWKRNRVIISLGALVLALGLWGYSQTKAWFPYEDNLPLGSPIMVANAKLADQFGGTYRLWSEMDLETGQSLDNPEQWSRLKEVTQGIREAAPGYITVSLSSFARWLGHPERMPDQDELADLPSDLRSLLHAEDGRTARVLTLVPEPMRNTTSLAVHDRIEQAARSAGAERLVGLPMIMRHESIAIIRQLGVGLLIASLASTIVIAAAFRWPSLALFLIGPNIIPLAVAAAALHVLSQGHLTPTAVLALTIAFGIAVNDSIHCVTRYRLELNRGLDSRAALRAAICGTGRVIMLTTLLLSVGLLVTQFSTFEPVRLFGQIMIISFVTALVADLFLLPALLKQGRSS